MPTLPMYDLKRRENLSPHVVVLGAGGSRACLERGDRHGRVIPVMADFVAVLGLEAILDGAGIRWRERNFEEIYSELGTNDANSDIMNNLNSKVETYFSKLELPDLPTSYDYLVLSLRIKDVIASFNWDPLLIQAYRRNLVARRLPHILFLHGNVGVGICKKCESKGYRDQLCAQCGNPFECTQLLYPIDKDYTVNSFIRSEWTEFQSFIKYAYMVTIFGYSAPSSDFKAKELMLEVWDKNDTRELASIELIDIKPEDQLYETWKPFITRHHYGNISSFYDSYLMVHPRRTCEALAWATLQQNPWPNDPVPTFDDLSNMQNWFARLIHEEDKLEELGVPFSRAPAQDNKGN